MSTQQRPRDTLGAPHQLQFEHSGFGDKFQTSVDTRAEGDEYMNRRLFTAERTSLSFILSLGILVGCTGSSPPSQNEIQKFLEAVARSDEKVIDLKLISVEKDAGICSAFPEGGNDLYVAQTTYVRYLGDCKAVKVPMPRMNCGKMPFNIRLCLYKSNGKWLGGPPEGVY